MKSATGLTGSGSRDWFIQRVSAVVLAAYTVVLFGWILCKGGFDYQQWAGFMMTLPMKIFSLLAILSLMSPALLRGPFLGKHFGWMADLFRQFFKQTKKHWP